MGLHGEVNIESNKSWGRLKRVQTTNARRNEDTGALKQVWREGEARNARNFDEQRLLRFVQHLALKTKYTA